jgi:hypothetical protein
MCDIILGADWLEDQGQMWIDLKQKIMKLKVAGKDVTLIGVKDNIDHCPTLSDRGLKCLLKRSAISHLV